MTEIRPDCPMKNCPGHLEAHTKVYLEVGGTFTSEDSIRIDALEFARLNDEYEGHPLDLEANFTVACTEGHEFAHELSPAVMAKVGLQPIGDAPRTLGRRGGL